VTPEAFVGGPLAFVHDGDLIQLDVASRTLSLLVSDEELAARRAAWTAPQPKFERGFGLLYSHHVLQADLGCDFDFLETVKSTVPAAEPEIH
jgi:dihydroxyacid dehydratase/phosphogluconate dehydratase